MPRPPRSPAPPFAAAPRAPPGSCPATRRDQGRAGRWSRRIDQRRARAAQARVRATDAAPRSAPPSRQANGAALTQRRQRSPARAADPATSGPATPAAAARRRAARSKSSRDPPRTARRVDGQAALPAAGPRPKAPPPVRRRRVFFGTRAPLKNQMPEQSMMKHLRDSAGAAQHSADDAKHPSGQKDEQGLTDAFI